MATLVIPERTSVFLAAFQRCPSIPVTPIAYKPIISILADTASQDPVFLHQHRSCSHSNSKSVHSFTRDRERPVVKIADPLSTS